MSKVSSNGDEVKTDFYYSQGALLKKDYDCICNLDIKPYY